MKQKTMTPQNNRFAKLKPKAITNAISHIFAIFKSAPWGVKIALLVLIALPLLVIFAPYLAPYGEAEIVSMSWEDPSAAFWLGTDNIGRDMLSRLIYGARTTIMIAILATFISFCIGMTAGFFAAIKGKWIDQILSRFVDMIMAVPSIIFALLILSILGTSTTVLIFVAATLDSTRVFRLSRAIAMDIRSMEFVEAAYLRGEKNIWIMAKEIWPNCIGPIVAEFGLRFCFQFLFISSLSFIGLGIQPPFADWGGMVRENATALSLGLMAPLYPAICIAVVTISVNLTIDWFLKKNTVNE